MSRVISKSSMQIAILALFLGGCKTTTISYRQEMLPSVTINNTKDTVVLMSFTGDTDNVAQSFENTLKEKGFKTMSMENYYDYRDDLKSKTNFVTIKGAVSKNVSPPTMQESMGEQCAIEEGHPIYLIKYTNSLVVDMSVLLNFTGIPESPYSQTISGSGSSDVYWTKCGRRGDYRTGMFPEPSVKEATDRALDMLDVNFSKIVAVYSENLWIVLYKGDNDITPALNAGNSMFEAGDLKSAVEQYKTAIKQAESNPKATKVDLGNCYYNLGLAQGYLGDSDAFGSLDKAYSINPDSTYLNGRNQMKQFFDTNKKLKEKGLK